MSGGKMNVEKLEKLIEYALWGKHEFDIEEQRNILLWFLKDNELDKKFMKYLDYWFPENEEGIRQSRSKLEDKVKKLQEKLEIKQ